MEVGPTEDSGLGSTLPRKKQCTKKVHTVSSHSVDTGEGRSIMGFWAR